MKHKMLLRGDVTLTNLAYLIASAFLLVVILAHADIVEIGQWQADDYDYAARLRDQGFGFAMRRLATDTPRPVSEFLILVYAEAVNRMHRPLIGTFLACGWAIMLLACCTRLVARPAGPMLPRLFLALSLVSLFLLGHPVADMLYWPVGMAAYVPTVAALCFLLIHILDDAMGTERGRWTAAAALVVAAASSEMGALVVLFFTAATLLTDIKKDVRGTNPLWLIVPLLMSLAVFGVTRLTGRGARPPTIPSSTGHNALESLRATLPQMLRDIGIIDLKDGDWGQEGIGSLYTGIPIKLLVLVGFALCARQCFRSFKCRPALTLAFALLFGMFASIFAAYYQFGFLCCQRHDAVRQCLMVMVLLVCGFLVAGLATNPNSTREWPVAGITCLMLAIVPMAIRRIPDLAQAYGSMKLSESSLQKTWQSGLSPGMGAVIAQQPAAPLVHAWSLPTGKHTLSSSSGRYDIRSLMHFFKKQEVTVLAPAQG